MSRQHEIDEQGLNEAAKEIVRRIREEEDPLELTMYRKMFKKAVPLFLRSYVAAYLFRQLYGKGNFSASSMSSGGSRKKITPVSLFVSIGKNRRVFPRDLVQLLISAGKVAKSDIGDIKILDNYAFVEVDESLAAQVIRNLDTLMYRGRRLTVNFAKKKAEDSQSSTKVASRDEADDGYHRDSDDDDSYSESENYDEDSTDPEVEEREKKDTV